MTCDKHPAPCNKHLAPRGTFTPCKKYPAPSDTITSRNKQGAFTLLEVLVALAVLAAGATALGHYAGAFNRVTSAEIAHADSALAAVAYLDSLAVSRPPCAETVLTQAVALPTPRPRPIVSPFKIRAVYTPVPGPYPLQWVEVGFGNFTLRRLVRCAKASR